MDIGQFDNFKVKTIQNERHFWSYIKNLITSNEQNHKRNNQVKTNSRYPFSVRRSVSFKFIKFKNSKWPAFLHF